MKCSLKIFILFSLCNFAFAGDFDFGTKIPLEASDTRCHQVIESITDILNRYWSSVGNKISDYKEHGNESKDRKIESASARNCFELKNNGDNESGIRNIFPFKESPNWGIDVVCEQKSDKGGWTVLQNRDALPIREDFHRSWAEYTLGFGNMTGEFWLGLNTLHALTTHTSLMEIRVELEDTTGDKRFAKYQYFSVGNVDEQFILHVGGYSGNAGDGLAIHNNKKFCTKDHCELLSADKKNPAVLYRGAWWYTPGHHSNLNAYQYYGDYKSYADGIGWYHFRGHHNSLKNAKMMIRPAFKRN